MNNVPTDYANPDWSNIGRVHEWKNHISERLRVLWSTFTDEQKQAIAESAEELAAQEPWD